MQMPYAVVVYQAGAQSPDAPTRRLQATDEDFLGLWTERLRFALRQPLVIIIPRLARDSSSWLQPLVGNTGQSRARDAQSSLLAPF